MQHASLSPDQFLFRISDLQREKSQRERRKRSKWEITLKTRACLILGCTSPPPLPKWRREKWKNLMVTEKRSKKYNWIVPRVFSSTRLGLKGIYGNDGRIPTHNYVIQDILTRKSSEKKTYGIQIGRSRICLCILLSLRMIRYWLWHIFQAGCYWPYLSAQHHSWNCT